MRVGHPMQHNPEDACNQSWPPLQPVPVNRPSPFASGCLHHCIAASKPSAQDESTSSNTHFRQQLAQLYEQLARGLVVSKPDSPDAYVLRNTSQAVATISKLTRSGTTVTQDHFELLHEFVVRPWLGFIMTSDAEASQHAPDIDHKGLVDLQLQLLRLVQWIVTSLNFKQLDSKQHDSKQQGTKELQDAAIASLLQSVCSAATAFHVQQDLQLLHDSSAVVGSDKYKQYIAQRQLACKPPSPQPLIHIACACGISDAGQVDEALQLLRLCLNSPAFNEERKEGSAVDTSPLWVKLFTPQVLVDVQVSPAAPKGVDLQAAVGKPSFSLPGAPGRGRGKDVKDQLQVYGRWWDGSVSHSQHKIVPRADVCVVIKELLQAAGRQQQVDIAAHLRPCLTSVITAANSRDSSAAAALSEQLREELLESHIQRRVLQLLQLRHPTITAAVLWAMVPQLSDPKHTASDRLLRLLIEPVNGQESSVLQALLQHVLPCVLDTCSNATDNAANAELTSAIVQVWLHLPAAVHFTSCLPALCKMGSSSWQSSQQAQATWLSLFHHSLCHASTVSPSNISQSYPHLAQSVWAVVKHPPPENSNVGGHVSRWVSQAVQPDQRHCSPPTPVHQEYTHLCSSCCSSL